MKSTNQKIAMVAPINLSKSQIFQIKKGLENVMGRDNFSLDVVQNANILGGVIIQIDSRVIDLSLNGKLNQISDLLANV